MATSSQSAPGAPVSYQAALVTGGARRLGRAMALGLAGRGIDIALHYNSNGAEAEATAGDIRALGVDVVTLQADLLDMEQTGGLIARARDGLGRDLDVLINSASVFRYDTLETATSQSWDVNVGSNLRAPFVLTQDFASQAPGAVRQENGEMLARACIVNMIDQRVRKLTKHYMTYTLGKTGLWALTQTSARALGPDIRVNGIGPGSTIQGADQSDAQFLEHRLGSVLQRGANPQDIVAAMNFLLDSPAFTGQLLCIDGGQHL